MRTSVVGDGRGSCDLSVLLYFAVAASCSDGLVSTFQPVAALTVSRHTSSSPEDHCVASEQRFGVISLSCNITVRTNSQTTLRVGYLWIVPSEIPWTSCFHGTRTSCDYLAAASGSHNNVLYDYDYRQVINLERDLVKLRAALESDRGSERNAIKQVTTTFSLYQIACVERCIYVCAKLWSAGTGTQRPHGSGRVNT